MIPTNLPYTDAIQFKNGIALPVHDALTIEEMLSISVNGNPYTITMRSPGDEEALVRGILYTENVYTGLQHAIQMDVTARNAQGFITAMDVTIPDNLLQPGIAQQRNLLSVSSCGMCGKYEIDLQLHGIVTKEVQLSATVIPAMFTEMAALQKIFAHTGGCHAASLCGQSGELLVCCEDIGRHNAVDKVIGSLLLSDRLDEAYCLLVSGRVSYEIVSKAHKANIPILCAVSAPSDMAVDCCRSCGITLLAFCRGSQYTIYTNSHRIRID